MEPQEYVTELYKRRNMIERLFGLIKRFGCVFARYAKTDLMFAVCFMITLIADVF
ncbi:MAG: hypothetical protein WD336_02210 [Trueperaceae bacterium]